MNRIIDRHAKIIATLGPSSQSFDEILALAQAGANIFRLNFSHGSYEDHENSIDTVRQVEKKIGHPLGLFMDLQGPKFRCGVFENSKVSLKSGQSFKFDLLNILGDAERVYLPHPEIIEAVSVGDRLLIDDGKMVVKVCYVGESHLLTRVQTDGVISDRKGISLPDAEIKVSALTNKDRNDLQFGLQHGIASVALSFVQRPEDIDELRELTGNNIQLISKIEKPTALNNLKEIIERSDAVMVARGDLGVELPPEKVPIIQKKIVALARNLGKPVIVATQMLETMIESPVSTRAEASDVASAVYDGVDAVMLSAETAAGKFPEEAVSLMSRIISEVENDPLYSDMLNASRGDLENTNTDAISAAARQVASTLNASAVICYSTTGKTALRAARERPEAPIIALTSDVKVARALSLAWGVYPVVCPDATNMQEMVENALEIVYTKKLLLPKETVVITAGVPFGNAGSTNILRIAKIRVTE